MMFYSTQLKTCVLGHKIFYRLVLRKAHQIRCHAAIIGNETKPTAKDDIHSAPTILNYRIKDINL